MAVIELESEFFDDEVLEADLPVLIDFWATWCGPCMMLSPTVDEIAEKYADKYKVCKVNVDACPDLCMRFGIDTIPTLLVFKNGQLVNKSVGVVTEDKILDMLDN